MSKPAARLRRSAACRCQRVRSAISVVRAIGTDTGSKIGTRTVDTASTGNVNKRLETCAPLCTSSIAGQLPRFLHRNRAHSALAAPPSFIVPESRLGPGLRRRWTLWNRTPRSQPRPSHLALYAAHGSQLLVRHDPAVAMGHWVKKVAAREGGQSAPARTMIS
jgi:hypothetical protein